MEDKKPERQPPNEKKPERPPTNWADVGSKVIGGGAVLVEFLNGFEEIVENFSKYVVVWYIIGFVGLIALIFWFVSKALKKSRLPSWIRFSLLPVALVAGALLWTRVVNPGEWSKRNGTEGDGQIFMENVGVSLYAGNGSEDVNEETGVGLREARFSGVGSLSVSGDTLYLSDYSKLCVMEDGNAILSDAHGGYGVQILHCHGDSVYFLTDVWSDSEETSEEEAVPALYLGFARIRDGEVSLLYQYEAGIAATASSEGRLMAAFSDFAVASNGDIWFLEQNYAMDYTILNRLPYDAGTDSYGAKEPCFAIQKRDVKETAQSRMAFDEEDNLYISLPERGQILRVGSRRIRGATDGEEYAVFAGVERTGDSMLRPVDGTAPAFCYPTSLAYADGYLYVTDFDMVRRIGVLGGQALDCMTFAGKHSETQRNVGIARGSGKEAEFVASNDAFLAVGEDGRVFLGDPKHRVIYLIRQTA